MINSNFNDTIELTLPVNSAYVSAIRLTASSIANRLKFDAEEIEDIKSAVSESCTFLINSCDKTKHEKYSIKFTILPDKISVCFTMPKMDIPDDVESDFSLVMIKGLMDSLTIGINENKDLEIIISKMHK